jgi:hypothetical protein
MNTDSLLGDAQASMEKAADDTNTLDRTVFYSNQAVVMMLTAVVGELRSLRAAVEGRTGEVES